MVIGIGVDITDIKRIEDSLAEFGERFRNRVFTAGEIAYCEQFANAAAKAERYAARFAAKEAARKALGAATPLKSLSWQEVEIISSTEGAPQLRFHGHAAALIEQLKITRAHVSLSHATQQAIAFVVLEKD
ncbi:MAG TPA: holo-ACP synthase [Blastocatellia bacterium]|nr:holo-ACP synthase [Blastocatellia bacterium]